METKERDRWDKAAIILEPVGGLLTALAVALVGILGSNFLTRRQQAESAARERMQAIDTNARLYTELMSKREESESALRKEVFKSILDSFFSPKSASLDERVLNLELLAYNFHESLDLKPLFLHLQKQVSVSGGASKREFQERLERVAREVTRKQMLVLEGAGQKFERTIDLETLRKTPGGVALDESRLKVGDIERSFAVYVLKADPKTKEIQVRLEIRTPKDTAGEIETNVAEFWVGFFDFPMIDNTRLSNDQRCAIVQNAFEDSTVDITVVYFPGSYAGLKEKPYYQEVVQNLLKTSKLLDQNQKK